MSTRIEEYMAGMPNLSLLGLSENWLLKECGHQHWLCLASLLGFNQPDFKDREGHTAYAAFVSLSITKAELGLVQENDRFSIKSDISDTGPARFTSMHRVVLNGQAIAELSMTSTLVRREQAGNNQSVTRAQVIADLKNPKTLPDLLSCAKAMHVQSRQLRGDRPKLSELWKTRFGDINLDRDPTIVVPMLPCPHSDFNGAGFLYFANFQQLVDRAEWQLQAASNEAAGKSLWLTQDRQIFYRGNVNVGDKVLIQEMARRCEGGRLHHWQRVYRASDGAAIADVLSSKRIAQGQECSAHISHVKTA